MDLSGSGSAVTVASVCSCRMTRPTVTPDPPGATRVGGREGPGKSVPAPRTAATTGFGHFRAGCAERTGPLPVRARDRRTDVMTAAREATAPERNR
ncbi:hypothetical protein AMK14_28065 [Streptomyces sp. TSRI0445]|uniref:Uncharacterized protein n=1 Tax=Streptomyces globisporus TaxID=1908 RepID=A0ABN8V696_STRGL|nr:hypothetical protein AMK14_28065 [Streptomyces sp. TSRI0445]CAH9417578.1 hypothetical protein SGL43_04625 [Streptomyces globisporus]